MPGILIAFSKREHAEKLKKLLLRSGFEVNAVCSSAAQTLALMDDLEGGILLCGYRLPDAIYSELAEDMPETFSMIVITSPGRLAEEHLPERVKFLPLPVKGSELTELLRGREEKQSVDKSRDNWRKERDRRIIERAKNLLMEKKNMDEPAAHHYLQKYAMDSGIRLVETAEKILTLYETQS